jgi:hypothetical protein
MHWQDVMNLAALCLLVIFAVALTVKYFLSPKCQQCGLRLVWQTHHSTQR